MKKGKHPLQAVRANTCSIASPKIDNPSLISSSVIISGGTNLKHPSPAVMTSNPLSLASFVMSPTIPLYFSVSCNPSNNPHPRISSTASGNRFRKCSSPDRNVVERERTEDCKALDARRVSTCCPMRQANGFPPNVVPWSPTLMC